MESFICLIGSLCWAATWAMIGHGFLRQSGRGSNGFWLGFLLGPLGCAIAFSISRSESGTPGNNITLKTMRVSSVSTTRRPAYPCPYCGAFTASHGLVTCRCGRQFEAP
jgi:hypothetical protein